jgi:SAM-dependent methyltransferase
VIKLNNKQSSKNSLTASKPLDWRNLPSAKSLKWQIQQQLDWLLPTVHGFSLVTYGEMATGFDYQRAAVANLVNLGTSSSADVICDTGQLPLANDDVDGFFLPFQLEQSKQPHQMLREIVRCLRPGGSLIIVAFNPYSIWGCYKLAKLYNSQTPWNLPFYSAHKLSDWFTVLGLDVKVIHGLFNHRPGREINQTSTLVGSKGYSRFGAINCIVAEKNTRCMTPIKPLWQRSKVVQGQIIEPSTRAMPRYKQ